ncbi:MAG: GNAT family N-acetyltransferase [Proteobacteria bacterium]|nr:GNAT family N-acetyltransferase [Pseudomonadota bacterium]
MSAPLILRHLNIKDEEAFLRGFQEWDGEDPTWYTFDWQKGMDFSALVAILDRKCQGIDIPVGRVPGSMLYAFVGDDIVGRVSIRHELNDALMQRGGHVGYAVAPRFRRKGYATEIFRQSLPYCQKLALEKVLITCSDTNAPSIKIIESFGGQLENKVWDESSKETVRRYWLSLQ